ncbi:GNAT family N-acetyltransferase [Microbacterium sediminis]|uniref:GNAT family N-acetyltransferase n=1 Tax=Microbacterium sediminis TaxID=904291 RepID=UPI000A06086B|nr:GNAT family protein [Microbacterium sediminis]QBR73322.1 N-acetyltransferase [Microbacterium sediminis]
MEHSVTERAAAADPLDAVDWPVHTERLVLRRATDADIDAMWAFRQLPEVKMWIGGAPDTFEGHRERMRGKRATLVTIVLPGADGDERVIGELMIAVGDGWAQAEVAEDARGTEAELGWTLDPAFQGHGYATEAVRAAIDLCFGPLGLRRVHAGCFADNVPSWKLMERLGMRREEHSRKTALHRSGVWMDGMNYGLLAEEWRGEPEDRP